jgi:HAD superfamily phosphatase (TIGR01668 family)
MLVRPTRIVADVTTIDLDWLSAQGVRGFIFDLDNTIMAPNTGLLDDKVKAWLATVKERGFQCVVVSNNPYMLYIKKAEAVLDFPCIGNAGKPRRKYLRKGVEMMGLDPHEVVVVGDRPLTDIWGGQRLGTLTILVDPLTKHSEHAVVRGLRRLERLFVIEGPAAQ